MISLKEKLISTKLCKNSSCLNKKYVIPFLLIRDRPTQQNNEHSVWVYVISYDKTRMHSSMMCTARFNGHHYGGFVQGGYPGGMCVPWGVCRGGGLVSRGCARGCVLVGGSTPLKIYNLRSEGDLLVKPNSAASVHPDGIGCEMGVKQTTHH